MILRFKKLFAFLFIFVFLFVLAVPSFATDVVMDGLSSDISALVSPIPIRAFSIRATSGVSTSDLDSYMFSSGGFFRSGDLINETMEIEYSFDDTSVLKTVNRFPDFADGTNITENFVVSGDAQHNTFLNSASFEVIVYFEDFWVYRDSHGSYPALYKPEFFIEAFGSNSSFYTSLSSGAMVSYSGYCRYGQMYDYILSSGQVGFDYKRRSFSYSDVTQYTDSVELVPDALLDTVSTLAQGSTIDEFNDAFIIEDLTARFIVYANTDVLGFSKNFGIDNYYYTYSYWQDIMYSIFYDPSYYKDVDAITSGGPVFIDDIPVGEFLDNSIGPFLDTAIFGWFSLGDLLGGFLGLALLFAFLRFFSGG